MVLMSKLLVVHFKIVNICLLEDEKNRISLLWRNYWLECRAKSDILSNNTPESDSFSYENGEATQLFGFERKTQNYIYSKNNRISTCSFMRKARFCSFVFFPLKKTRHR